MDRPEPAFPAWNTFQSANAPRSAMSRQPPSVRPPTARDAPAISALVAQLGYPAPAEAIPARLAALGSDSKAIALVAETGGEIVGIVTGHIIHSIHDDHPVAQLTTLVVADAHRGAGVGSLLVSRIEEWAKASGAGRISLTSGLQRHESHRFYENRGYERSGVRLAKKFGAE